MAIDLVHAILLESCRNQAAKRAFSVQTFDSLA